MRSLHPHGRILDKEVGLSGLGKLVVTEMRRALTTAFVWDSGAFTIVHIYWMPVLYAVSNVFILYALSNKTCVCVRVCFC